MVVYFDNSILAVNKKAGISVQEGKNSAESLKKMLEPEYGSLFVVHRIDTPVSGIVIFARTKAAAADLSRQFSLHTPVKRYLAATDISLPGGEGRLTDNIHVPSGNKANKVYLRNAEDKSTKKASLRYKEIFKTDKYHIFEIILETGRRHQIRVQLAGSGCHIKGDVKYGARRTNPGGGIHLHALSIEFTHPEDGRKIFLKADLPDDPIWNSVPPELYTSTVENSEKPD
ncbi:MAG: RNA pseudouridine synthase [Spirochaetales bacterium]|nr:RNA pseudouridine synthase [Spirochaetales bacterium]